MTGKIDEAGHYVLDKPAVVTVTLNDVTDIALGDFNLPGIIFDLNVTRLEDGFELTWTGSYGSGAAAQLSTRQPAVILMRVRARRRPPHRTLLRVGIFSS